MDWRDVEAFVAVAEEGSFTAAGRRLVITGSAVSQRVSRLERLLGVKLLERTTRSVTLTPAGKLALRTSEGMVDLWESLRREIDAEAGAPEAFLRHPMTVALVDVTPQRLLPQMVRAFAPRTVDVRVLPDSEVAMESLALGDADGVLAMQWPLQDWPRDSCPATCTIVREHLWVALPADHPRADQATVDIAELGHEEWVDHGRPGGPSVLEAVAATAGFRPRARHYTGDTAVAAELVRNGACDLTSPVRHPRDGVVFRPLRPVMFSRLVLVWQPGRVGPRDVDRLIRAARTWYVDGARANPEWMDYVEGHPAEFPGLLT